VECFRFEATRTQIISRWRLRLWKSFCGDWIKVGTFDIAILECGQYGKSWPYIHMLPEETVAAAKDLGAEVLLPVHWAKFELAFHDWDDSIKRVTKSASDNNQRITTPLIGEPVVLGSSYPNKVWWVLN